MFRSVTAMDDEIELELTCPRCGKAHAWCARTFSRFASQAELTALASRDDGVFPCMECIGAEEVARRGYLMILGAYTEMRGLKADILPAWAQAEFQDERHVTSQALVAARQLMTKVGVDIPSLAEHRGL
jgi:hypothetical protein